MEDSFRNFLFEIGLVSYSDSMCISSNNPIDTLTNYMTNLDLDDIYDLSERVYHTWLDRNFEKAIYKLDVLVRLRTARSKYTALLRWYKNRTNKNLRKRKRSMQSPPGLPKRHKSSPQKISSTLTTPLNSALTTPLNSTLSDVAQALLSSSPTQPRHLQSFSPKNRSRENTPPKAPVEVFNRLHADSARKNQKLRQSQAQILNRELDECTFRPQITARFAQSERHSHRKNSLSQDYASEKLKAELAECTFHPQTTKHKANRDSSFEALYKDAEVQRKNQRKAQADKENKHKEVHPFQPQTRQKKSVNTPKGVNNNTPKAVNIHERLYQTAGAQAKKKYKEETAAVSQKLAEWTFMPEINKQKSPLSRGNIYNNLFMDYERRQARKDYIESAIDSKQTTPKQMKSEKPLTTFDLAPPVIDSKEEPVSIAEQMFLEIQEKIKATSPTKLHPTKRQITPDVTVNDSLQKIKNERNHGETVLKIFNDIYQNTE